MAMTRDVFESRLQAVETVLRSMIQSHTHNHADTQDILQDVTLKAWKNIESLNDANSFGAWTKQIATNAVYDWQRGQGRRRWQPLYDEIAQEGPQEEKVGFHAFSDAIAQFQGRDIGVRYLLPLSLQYCFDWSAQEIATILGHNLGTVRSTIQRGKRMLMQKPSGKPQHHHADAELKAMISQTVFNLASMTVQGNHMRNRVLAEEAYYFGKLTGLQYPEFADIQGMLCVMAFRLAELKEYEDRQDTLPVVDPGKWRRNLWDRKYKQEAREYYARFHALPQLAIGLFVDSCFAMYDPDTNEEVDWKNVLELCLRFIDLKPKTRSHVAAARALRMVEGPARAAAYLKEHEKNSEIANDMQYHYLLAEMYLETEQWKLAHARFAKCLQWPTNQALQRRIREAMDICHKELAKQD